MSGQEPAATEFFEDDVLLGRLFSQAASHLGKRPEGDVSLPVLGDPLAEAATADTAEDPQGQLQVDISDDRMTAWLSVVPQANAEPFERATVMDVLGGAGLVHGVDRAVVFEAMAATKPVRLKVAIGDPPQNGRDSVFTVLCGLMDRGSPVVREDGSVDFHDLNLIQSVAAGAPLMRREPPTPGIPGRTVTGEAIPAKAGQEKPFVLPCMGAEISAHDPDLLVATQGGMPKILSNSVHVLPLLTVERVDLSTGNIAFDGTVVVNGSVAAGFRVWAAGDIHIKGIVEAAELFAKGSIRIDKGVVGQGKAKIRSYGDVSAFFIESAELVEAGGRIVVDEQVLHSQLVAFDHVLVNSMEGKGQIIGGSVQAGGRVECKSLGAVSNVVTRVEVGTIDFDQVITGLRLRRNVRTQALKKVTPGSKEHDLLMWDINVLNGMESGLLERKALLKTARIVAHQMVYGGVLLKIQEVRRAIQEDALGATFRIAADGSELLAGATLY